jgi:hypothetical protein
VLEEHPHRHLVLALALEVRQVVLDGLVEIVASGRGTRLDALQVKCPYPSARRIESRVPTTTTAPGKDPPAIPSATACATAACGVACRARTTKRGRITRVS